MVLRQHLLLLLHHSDVQIRLHLHLLLLPDLLAVLLQLLCLTLAILFQLSETTDIEVFNDDFPPTHQLPLCFLLFLVLVLEFLLVDVSQVYLPSLALLLPNAFHFQVNLLSLFVLLLLFSAVRFVLVQQFQELYDLQVDADQLRSAQFSDHLLLLESLEVIDDSEEVLEAEQGVMGESVLVQDGADGVIGVFGVVLLEHGDQEQHGDQPVFVSVHRVELVQE